MIKKAHRNAESKPKQWEWDDQRAIHIRMRHKNVKKCIINYSIEKGLPCLLLEQRGTMPRHMPQIPIEREPTSGAIQRRGITVSQHHRPCPPAVLTPTGAVLMGNSSYSCTG